MQPGRRRFAEAEPAPDNDASHTPLIHVPQFTETPRPSRLSIEHGALPRAGQPQASPGDG